MTSLLRKSRRITAPNAPTAIDRRTTTARSSVIILSLIAALALTPSVRGAEMQLTSAEGKGLKWRAPRRGGVTLPTRSADEPTRLQLNVEPAPEPLLEPALTEASSSDSTDIANDGEVLLLQALGQPANDALKDPFGDKKAPPNVLPRVTPPATAPAVTAPTELPAVPLTPTPSTPAPSTLPVIPRGDQLAAGGGFQQEPCPKSDQFKKIDAITNRIAASAGDVPVECPIDDRVEASMNRPWSQTCFTWKASGLCHKPLYFEEIALERYGHSTGPISQPIVSTAHFFATVPFLPYQMGMDPPWECKYALGYYRPGSCAPYIVPPVPLSPQGAVVGGATAAGLILIFP